MSISCVPQDLITAAKCFFCVKPSARPAVRSYLLCQGANKPGGLFGVPAPTGFAFLASDTTGNTVVASWNTPPSGITATEVWTSTDNITYALSSTVAAPGTSQSLGYGGAGIKNYCKIRWITATSQSAFSDPVFIPGEVPVWIKAVITNGGAAVAQSTALAVNAFGVALANAGVDSKMKSAICVVPDNLTAATTPLYKVFGLDPWLQNGTFALTVNGIVATSGNSHLETGVIPSACFASTSTGGLSAYVFTTTNADGAAVDMGSNNSNAQTCQLYTNFSGSPGSAFSQIYNNTTGSCGGPGNGTGFYCGNVTGAAAAGLYYGSSGLGFTTIGTLAGGGGTRPTIQIYAMGLNQNGVTAGTTTIRRYSFFAIHDGLTSTQAQALFNAVQALRVALGGGFV